MSIISPKKILPSKNHHGHKLYEVDEILEKQTDRKGNLLYKVKWAGYKSNSASWEPIENLTSCWNLLEEFELKESKMGRPSGEIHKSSGSTSRGRSPARKSTPSSSTISKTKRSSTKSRSRTPTRSAKSKGTLVKKSPSPPPVKHKRAASKKSRPVSKSPSRQSVVHRKKPAESKPSPVKTLSSLSSAGITPPRKAGSKETNGLTFAQMISASKSKGVALLSDLFSSPPARKSQPPFYRRLFSSICLPSFQLLSRGSNRRSPSPTRGSFASALAIKAPRSSSRSGARRWSPFHAFLYAATIVLILLVGYISYVQRKLLATKTEYGALFVRQTYSSFGKRLSDAYQQWTKQ